MLREEQEIEEEFQEADILWPDAGEKLELPQMYYYHDDGDENSGEHGTTKPRNQQKASSPIDIPGGRKSSWTSGAQATRAPGMPGVTSRFGASYAGGGVGSIVMTGSHVFAPPHVIVDRRAKRQPTAMFMLVDVPEWRRAREMVIQE